MKGAALLVAVAGCAVSSVPAVRFANQPVVTVLDDRRDVPTRPANRDVPLYQYYFDAVVYRPLTRSLELQRSRRARGVNAVDEVPDSTWFTNRIGVRELTLDELRAAPGGVGTPEAHFPWTIHTTKVGGRSVGFIITDARGLKFVLKFDRLGHPETETAAHLITGKLLWAFGYNVTDDYLVHFRRKDLVLAPDAVITSPYGGKQRLNRDELERRLATIVVQPDGRIRGLASAWIEGKPIGGHASEGVRADDPNDRIPHEQRRDLRGAFPLFAWLDHGDAKEGNTFDVWIEDPRDRTRHYVKHLLIDFGQTLGFFPLSTGDQRIGHEYRADWDRMLRSFVTLGAEQRSWEGRPNVGLRGVGMFEGETFEPGSWKPGSQAYIPLLQADRFDKFWGAKILMRFTREQIHAVVASAELTDPRAAAYLVEMLVARQRATGRYWFSRVNPLDRFTLNAAHGLCFEDLAVVYGFEHASTTAYIVRRYDLRGHSIGAVLAVRAAGRGTCVGLVPLASGDDGYTIVRITTTRPGFSRSTYIHVARDPATGAPRIIGLWRT